jgi:hypothetical protein
MSFEFADKLAQHILLVTAVDVLTEAFIPLPFLFDII